MERWIGRAALVTGANGGIGVAICKALVTSGMRVVGADITVDKLKDLVNELKDEKGSLMAVKYDLTKDEDIYALFNTVKDSYRGVDICINNAGFSFNNSLLDGSPQEWRGMMDVNVIALCLCTKLAVASMRERGIDDGHIININRCNLLKYVSFGSFEMNGHTLPVKDACKYLGHVIPNELRDELDIESNGGHKIIPAFYLHFYSATKHAVTAITEGLRQELREAKSHIRASSISPGITETGFMAKTFSDVEKAKQFLSSRVYLQATDVASTVLHVISSPPHVEVNEVTFRSTEHIE